MNWCQHWFEYFPNPPLNILSMAENVLAHHDKELLQHLVDCGITSQVTTAKHNGQKRVHELSNKLSRITHVTACLCPVYIHTFYCVYLL